MCVWDEARSPAHAEKKGQLYGKAAAYFGIAKYPMIEVLPNPLFGICEHRSVCREQGIDIQLVHSSQGLHISRHMAFGGIDNDRAETGHQVARH